MTTTNPAGCKAEAICNRYGLEGVNFGSKFISEIMDASQKGEAWATKIMEADRQPVSQHWLNPNARTNNNLYGALLSGVEIKVPQRSRDETVKKTFQEWGKNLKADFPQMLRYTPKSLGERAANLLATSSCLRASLDKLCATGDIAAADADHWSKVIDTLKGYGQAAEKLHQAVCAGPNIESVQLDIPSRQH